MPLLEKGRTQQLRVQGAAMDRQRARRISLEHQNKLKGLSHMNTRMITKYLPEVQTKYWMIKRINRWEMITWECVKRMETAVTRISWRYRFHHNPYLMIHLMEMLMRNLQKFRHKTQLKRLKLITLEGKQRLSSLMATLQHQLGRHRIVSQMQQPDCRSEATI